MRPVSEILDRKGSLVVSVNREETVFDAICLMADLNIGAVMVTDGEEIAGIFTERDYLQRVALKSLTSRETPVSDVMTRQVVSAGPGDTIEECMEIVTRSRCRHLPVVEDGKLLGLVSIGDLVKALLDEKEAETEHLAQYIAGSY
jgi:CBS domain-containing protein